EQDIGSLVIMDHGQLAGMLTFREIISYLHRAKGNVGDYTVRSIMDDAPVSVSPNTGFEEVQRLMLEKHARYIPVMDGPTLLGVISFYDMAAAIVAAQAFENTMLKADIRDWPGNDQASAQVSGLCVGRQFTPGTLQQTRVVRSQQARIRQHTPPATRP